MNTSANASTPRPDTMQRSASPRGAELRPDVDLEVRASRTPIMAPIITIQTKQEARHLLGPDVARDQVGVAREDLQR